MPKAKRTPSIFEKTIGIAILLIILIIGIGIYVKGQHYNPNLFSPDISEFKQSTDSSGASLINTNLSQDWKPMGEVEFYNADNLYEKIDGKAEQYLDYDVVGLQTVTLIEKNGKRFVDLYVYDMGEPLNAFGIFSALRHPSENSIDLGQGGYKSDGYFFWKGKYYTQVILSDQGKDIEKFASELAGNIESKQKEMPVDIWGLGKFPKKNLVPNSILYFKKEGLNLSFLNDVYVAIYEKEGTEIKAFLSKKKDSSEANQVFEAYRNYLNKYGKVVDETEIESGFTIIGEMFGYYDVVFRKDNIVGGTNSVENRKYAEEISHGLFNSN